MQEIQNLDEKIQLAQFYDDPLGYATFYELVFGRPLPRICFGWVEQIYASSAKDFGTVVEAFRGSTKTTSVTIGFTAFRIGHDPLDSNMIIQAAGDSAERVAQAIAEIIEINPAWKAVFPWITPDKSVGWASTGYEIQSAALKVADDSEIGFSWAPVSYEEFRRQKSAVTKDRTLLGLGVGSTDIIGKHPTGMLLLDDVHDDKNSASEREMLGVRRIVDGTIMPITTTPQGNTRFRVVVGTPWKANDVLADFKARKRFDKIWTPIVIKGKPTWPEAFGLERFENIKDDVKNPIEVARMYLLDLTAAEGTHLKKHWLGTFPYEDIKDTWPVVMGVDYASTADTWATKGKERDYFAMAIVRLKPGGGAVVIDGVRERMSQGEAEIRVKAIASMYPTLQLIGVEAIGKGEEFYHLLLRTSKLPIIPMFTKGKGKGERFEKQMAPLFQFGRAQVSSRPTPFLEDFEREWLQFPEGLHDDTLDAVFWALDAGRHNMYGIPDNTPLGVTNPLYDNKPKHPNPALALGRK